MAYTNPADLTSTVSRFYLFSNVNNGKPKMSCKEPIKRDVLAEAKFYIMICYGIALASFVSLMIIFGVLMKQCISKFRGKSNNGGDSKKRAGNGMVINEQDFDEIDQKSENKGKDIEMADRAKKEK